MNRQELESILPHRGRMLLLDECENIDGAARGVYNIKGDEFFLDGHFRGNPIVPGVIQCEILAQSACVLLDGVVKDGKLAVYTGLNNVKFRSQVKPGDRFETEVRLTKVKHPFYFAEGTGSVGGRVCVKAEFSFAVIDAPASSGGCRPEN